MEIFIGFEAVTSVVMKSSVFWDIPTCSSLKVNQRFVGFQRGNRALHAKRQNSLEMEIFTSTGRKTAGYLFIIIIIIIISSSSSSSSSSSHNIRDQTCDEGSASLCKLYEKLPGKGRHIPIVHTYFKMYFLSIMYMKLYLMFRFTHSYVFM
jgi:hypothetical protein